ncbi:MAG: N-acetylmuramoyl-L-alanine amidase [Treponema sp.]|jgi:N-acetylmuramoyl-L-alanine amidase|nr:N-acetylmuramoyl-L-alanine amidase [Treponema sp.]
MYIEERLLPLNPFSRPGKPLKPVRGVVLHWVGNPRTTAIFNRNYFASLKNQKTGATARYASAHYVIGLDGEVVRCLPESEMAYHVGAERYTNLALEQFGAYPNNCTLGVELCHRDWAGEFTAETLESCIELVEDLLYRHGLTAEDLYRHFDVTGKDCPRYFVRHGDRWDAFRRDIDSAAARVRAAMSK